MFFIFKPIVKAPRGRAIAIDINKPEPKHWQEIIPQNRRNIRKRRYSLNNQFVAEYLKDARSQIKIYDFKGAFVREARITRYWLP